MVMDLPTAKLVVATVEEDIGERYIHFWVEVRAFDFDPSRYEEDRQRLLPLNRNEYRREIRARDLQVVSRRFVMDFAKRGALSAWILNKSGPSHRFDRVMGSELLNALNFPHQMDGPIFRLPRSPQL